MTGWSSRPPAGARTLAVVSTHLELPDSLAERIAAEAGERGVTVEEAAIEALTERFGEPRRKLSFVGSGTSTSGHRARDSEATLSEGGFGEDRAHR